MNNILSRIRIVFLAVLGLLAATPAMALETLSLPMEQRVKHGADVIVKLTHEDLTGTTTNATVQVIPIWTVANKVAVSVVKSVIKTEFEDTATAGYNSLLLEVGDGSDTDRFLTSTQINDNGTEVDQKIGTGVTYAYTASDTVDAQFTPMALYTGAQLNAGEIWIYLKIHDDR